MKRQVLLILLLILGTLQFPAALRADVPTIISPTYNEWLGHWTGPEGTALDIKRQDADFYAIQITTLDGTETYEGIAGADGIQFIRGTKSAVIRAGSGKDTGMKWLSGKKNCLVISKGEGYCRN